MSEIDSKFFVVFSKNEIVFTKIFVSVNLHIDRHIAEENLLDT